MPRCLGSGTRAGEAVTDPDRICVLCGKPIPERKGVYHAGRRHLSHQGHCSEVLDGLERAYDRSARGRWRTSREYALALDEARRRYLELG